MTPLVCTSVLIAASLGYLFGNRGLPFVGRYIEWSIGIYTGPSPFEIGPHHVNNPVLTAADVTDVRAEFVADPFLFKTADGWLMFFEVLNLETHQGDIAVASSPDLKVWTYDRVVLDEGFHLSFPQVFEIDGMHYMLPESSHANDVRLYRATSFPHEWELDTVLLTGEHTDPAVFQHDGRWWMYTTPSESNDVARLYVSDTLRSGWTEHPASPIVYLDATRSRAGGRVLAVHDRVIRFAQDDLGQYGLRVRAFEVTKLTATEYEEREIDWSALDGSGEGWNADGMHHVDLHWSDGSWVAAVDGWRRAWRFSRHQ
jgi:hypothetical protein